MQISLPPTHLLARNRPSASAAIAGGPCAALLRGVQARAVPRRRDLVGSVYQKLNLELPSHNLVTREGMVLLQGKSRCWITDKKQVKRLVCNAWQTSWGPCTCNMNMMSSEERTGLVRQQRRQPLCVAARRQLRPARHRHLPNTTHHDVR